MTARVKPVKLGAAKSEAVTMNSPNTTTDPRVAGPKRERRYMSGIANLIRDPDGNLLEFMRYS